MRLLLDARKIEDYGIGVYIKQVFGHLIKQDFEEVRVIHLKGKERLPVPPEKEIVARAGNYNALEQVEIPCKCRHLKGYYYFSPHYIFPLFMKQRLLVTVHDLIHFLFPHFFKPGIKVEIARYFLREIKRRAAVIFTVSRRTALDLNLLFNIPPEKIKVIYNGVGQEFFNQPPSLSPLPFPYILYVGNWKPHKNLPLLLKAFSQLSRKYPELRLVLAGVTKNRAVFEALAALDLEKKCLLPGFLSQQEVIRYLDGALFFVFPSLYEGFGLPPLEAMARGRAVLSSPGGSLKEVLAEAALYFDPTSVDDLVTKMELLLTDEEKRRFYEKKGRERSRLFGWKKSLQEYVYFLKSLD